MFKEDRSPWANTARRWAFPLRSCRLRAHRVGRESEFCRLPLPRASKLSLVDLHDLHGRPERLLRQAKTWKGGSHELKPFVAVQRVRHPPGKGAARQPEASLARRAATRDVKRRQQVTKRRGKPRNRENDDAFIVKRCGGSTGSAANGEAQRVIRGRGPAQSHGMDRQGTWEVLPLPVGKEAGEGWPA